MACSITKGLKLACKDSRGGIKKIDFAIFDEYGFTVTAQEVATLPVTLTEVFRYEVKGTGNTLVETGTINTDNRTTEIAQVITAVFPKLNKDTEVQLQALEAGRVIAFVHDYNGNVKVVGIDSGMDATTSAGQTGGAGGDLSGYNITLQSMDSKRAPFLSTSAKTALEALVSDEVVEP
jgi:hypothetical protein